MKKFILFAHVYTWWILALPVHIRAQDSLNTYPNYVVIGAFAIHANAIQFTDDAKKHQFPARFEMNPGRNLYYVYVLATGDREHAFAEALELRAHTKYFDTWVYSGPLGNIGEGLLADAGPGVDLDPERQMPRVERASTGGTRVNDADRQADKPVSQTVKVNRVITDGLSADRTPAQPPGSNTNDRGEASPALPPVKVSTQPLMAEEVAGKNFYFHLFREDNHKMVQGEVDAIDFEKSRKMATYQGNSPVKVMMPSGKTKQISFVCQVFGYRKQQLEFNPSSPAEEFYLDDNGNLVLPFELMRLQKGDIAIMYNVFFFKDAAVMRPESRYEVNNLLELLVENPGYRITIHGHTNGNASGKIIRMDKPENFYSLTGTKQGYGSAKQLSEDRAIVIREFLISSGIAADRMEIKAWGGKKPIHDKHSVRANENVRVEIEILSN